MNGRRTENGTLDRSPITFHPSIDREAHGSKASEAGMSRLRNAPDVTCENQAVGLRTMARASDDSARKRAELSYVLFDFAVDRRQALISHLLQREIFAVFHYLPLDLFPDGADF